MASALALISDPLTFSNTTTISRAYVEKKMSRFRYTPPRAYAIWFTTEELRSMPEFKDERLRRPDRPEGPVPPDDSPGEYPPDMLFVYLLGNKVKDIWPKARRGMVHVKWRNSSSYDIFCAVVLADNKSREAMEIPSPDKLEEIMKLINAPRKPYWYELEP